MEFSNFTKSPAVVVFPDNSEPGLKLLHYYYGNTLSLDVHRAALWNKWPNSYDLETAKRTFADFLNNNFAIRRESQKSIEYFEIDSFIPTITGSNVKWYSESPDLTIIFNTAQMSINNPLLALGPYGSMIWRGIAAGLSIGILRQNANSIYGKDETIRFLLRLSSLGFINSVNSIENYDSESEELIKEFPAPFIQHLLTKSTIPWYCLWEICSTCNLKCKTCYLPKLHPRSQRTDISTYIASKIIDSGFFYVTILGGEPLTKDDLEHIVYKLRKAGVFVKVISNGSLLSSERAAKLCNAGLNQIEISLDGLSPSTHDFSRGTGSFNLALRAIANSLDATIPRVGIILTIYSENCHELSQLPAFMKKHGIKECYISIFRKIGGCGSCSHFTPIKNTHFLSIREEIENITRRYRDLSITILSECTCGKTSLVIGETGDVRPCPFRQTTAGNLCDEALIEIWKSMANRIVSDTAIPSPEYCKLTINE